MVLKLSKEKWEEAATHASQAVQSDFRRRVWYPPAAAATVGLVYGCKYGAVQLKDPVCECRAVRMEHVAAFLAFVCTSTLQRALQL